MSTTAQVDLEELRAEARRLWPDRDDAEVMSRLTVVLERIREHSAAENGRPR